MDYFVLECFHKSFVWLQDVHDRALFYYRLLRYNVSVAERVVNPPKQAVSVFADTQSSEVKDRIFDEFNSLSVVYQKVSVSFFHSQIMNVSIVRYFIIISYFSARSVLNGEVQSWNFLSGCSFICILCCILHP